MEFLKEFFTIDNVNHLIETHPNLSLILAVVFPYLESLLPFLPLIVFAVVNVNVFGLWLGFFLTWVGAVAGSITVFWIFRKFGHLPILTSIWQRPTMKKGMTWIEKHGFGPVFILLCFPFTPSAIVNIIAGISNMKFQQYMLATSLGKLFSIFMMCYIGSDFHKIITDPFRLIMTLLAILVLWILGKIVEKRLNSRL